MTALYMARIEAGLLLLDVDFHSSRFAWTDAERTTPLELGLGWMFRDLADDRAGLHRARRARREQAAKTSRWRLTGLIVDWRDYDRIYDEAGLIPPKDHTPIQDEYYVYDDELKQLGYATSQMYSPMLQRHIALARVPLELAKPGCRVKLELAVSHRYEYFDAASPGCRSTTPIEGPPSEETACNDDDRHEDGTRRSDLRRDRHRRRPQRPDEQRLSREGRPEGARPRAPARRRRRRDHRGAPAGLLVHDLLVRPVSCSGRTSSTTSS